MGGSAPSARVTENPFRRVAIAAANPAGPPPTTNTSVSRFVPVTQSAFPIFFLADSDARDRAGFARYNPGLFYYTFVLI